MSKKIINIHWNMNPEYLDQTKGKKRGGGRHTSRGRDHPGFESIFFKCSSNDVTKKSALFIE